jgi:hypothetical protein
LAGGEVWYAGNVPITHYRSTSKASPLFIEWHKTKGACYYFKKHFRSAYPNWTLSIVSAALWGRFFLLALREFPAHLRGRGAKASDAEFGTSLSEARNN